MTHMFYTILGTNGLISADVPAVKQQANKQRQDLAYISILSYELKSGATLYWLSLLLLLLLFILST